jgi:hypothetical protein
MRQRNCQVPLMPPPPPVPTCHRPSCALRHSQGLGFALAFVVLGTPGASAPRPAAPRSSTAFRFVGDLGSVCFPSSPPPQTENPASASWGLVYSRRSIPRACDPSCSEAEASLGKEFPTPHLQSKQSKMARGCGSSSGASALCLGGPEFKSQPRQKKKRKETKNKARSQAGAQCVPSSRMLPWSPWGLGIGSKRSFQNFPVLVLRLL